MIILISSLILIRFFFFSSSSLYFTRLQFQHQLHFVSLYSLFLVTMRRIQWYERKVLQWEKLCLSNIGSLITLDTVTIYISDVEVASIVRIWQNQYVAMFCLAHSYEVIEIQCAECVKHRMFAFWLITYAIKIYIFYNLYGFSYAPVRFNRNSIASKQLIIITVVMRTREAQQNSAAC